MKVYWVCFSILCLFLLESQMSRIATAIEDILREYRWHK